MFKGCFAAESYSVRKRSKDLFENEEVIFSSSSLSLESLMVIFQSNWLQYRQEHCFVEVFQAYPLVSLPKIVLRWSWVKLWLLILRCDIVLFGREEKRPACDFMVDGRTFSNPEMEAANAAETLASLYQTLWHYTLIRTVVRTWILKGKIFYESFSPPWNKQFCLLLI